MNKKKLDVMCLITVNKIQIRIRIYLAPNSFKEKKRPKIKTFLNVFKTLNLIIIPTYNHKINVGGLFSVVLI